MSVLYHPAILFCHRSFQEEQQLVRELAQAKNGPDAHVSEARRIEAANPSAGPGIGSAGFFPYWVGASPEIMPYPHRCGDQP